MKSRSILIFAKEPRPGFVKTRMCPPWSPLQAAELSLCFIRDTLLAASRVQDASPYLFVDPPEAISFFRDIAPAGFVIIPQQGDGFTERCAHSVKEAFRRGHTEIVQIGTDTPQIRAEHIEAAFGLLVEYNIGFGPTEDGGYYLLSLSRPAIEIYDGVVMGRDTVGKKMLANARRLGLRIKILDEWIDADTHADLSALHADPEVTLGRNTRDYLLSRPGP
ncbi:MAG: TIGR04282 family arsenosugar biosynthesis glycosyltransferase [bacterium]